MLSSPRKCRRSSMKSGVSLLPRKSANTSDIWNVPDSLRLRTRFPISMIPTTKSRTNPGMKTPSWVLKSYYDSHAHGNFCCRSFPCGLDPSAYAPQPKTHERLMATSRYTSVYLLHGKGGWPGGSVLQLEDLLRKSFPEPRY